MLQDASDTYYSNMYIVSYNANKLQTIIEETQNITCERLTDGGQVLRLKNNYAENKTFYVSVIGIGL